MMSEYGRKKSNGGSVAVIAACAAALTATRTGGAFAATADGVSMERAAPSRAVGLLEAKKQSGRTMRKETTELFVLELPLKMAGVRAVSQQFWMATPRTLATSMEQEAGGRSLAAAEILLRTSFQSEHGVEAMPEVSSSCKKRLIKSGRGKKGRAAASRAAVNDRDGKNKYMMSRIDTRKVDGLFVGVRELGMTEFNQ